MSTAQTFAENNPGIPEDLAQDHFNAAWSGNYWGPQGALAMAVCAADHIKSAGTPTGGTVKANFFLLSAYYSAAGSAIAAWKKNKKNVVLLLRGGGWLSGRLLALPTKSSTSSCTPSNGTATSAVTGVL